MAELLIKSSDTTNPDPVKDLRGCYKKGDVVVVKPDGWSWGKEELKKEKFYILRIPDKKPEELKYLVQEHRIQVGTRYISGSPDLGVYVDGTDPDAVLAECQKRCQMVVDEIKKFGIMPEYKIESRQEPIENSIVRRRIKVEVDTIETELKEGLVELTSDEVTIYDKPEKTTTTIALRSLNGN